MKRFLLLTCIILMVLSVNACVCDTSPTDGLALNKEESWFSDYEIAEENVSFYCVISITNDSPRPQKFVMYGDIQEDMEKGLVKEQMLRGYNSAEGNAAVFEAMPGENTYNVVFTGTFAGNAQKQTRLLPPITIELQGNTEDG